MQMRIMAKKKKDTFFFYPSVLYVLSLFNLTVTILSFFFKGGQARDA